MTRLLVLLFWLCSVAGFGQRRSIVHEPQVKMIQFYPTVQRSSMSRYEVDTNVYKSYTSWANLAELSRKTSWPISLRLVLDSANQQSDWASLRNVQHVRWVGFSMPDRLPPPLLDSLLNALANWPELTHIDINSSWSDSAKPHQSQPAVGRKSPVQLPTVQTANVFGGGVKLASCVEFLSHCSVLNKLTINGSSGDEKPLSLPAELAQLKSLHTLQLSSGQGFSGLDSAFAGLTELTTLYMTNTGDGRKLTKALNHMPKLRRLELRFGITDSDLNELRLGKLSQLDTLECHFITGTRFPVDSVLEGVPALKMISLHYCRLPAFDWLADHRDLQTIKLSSCQFPPSTRSLAKLTRLETISIEQADSLGQFPEPFTTLPNLRELNLPDAQIRALPPSIGNLISLTALNLYHNKLCSLPAGLGKLIALKTLNLGNNELTQLPAALLRLPRLETLALYENQLASLPADVGQLPHLRHLFLSNNQLTALPPELGKCRQLESLRLDYNPLIMLPETIGNLDSLRTLGLLETRLRALPSGIGKLTKLHTLNLSGGHLVTLPNALGRCLSLTALELSDSTLTALPDSFTALTRLSLLYLALPQVRTLPAGLTKCQNLERVTLFMPRLALLPENLGDLRKLTSLKMWCEQLLGLPNSIGRLKLLTDLVVIGSVASGTIGRLEQLPDSIVYCESLKRVSIKDQQAFDGADAIRKLARIDQLGSVALDHCGISDLTNIDWKTIRFGILTLQENNLRRVPAAIAEMPNMRTLNLSGNALLPPVLNQTFFIKDNLRKALAEVGEQR